MNAGHLTLGERANVDLSGVTSELPALGTSAQPATAALSIGVGNSVREPLWPLGPGLRAQSEVKAKLIMGQGGSPPCSLRDAILDISPPR